MPTLTRDGVTMTVADGTVPYWLGLGWSRDDNGDGVPDGSGRSVTDAQVVEGHLVIAYSDGSSQDAGAVGGIATDTDGTPYLTGA